MKSNKQLIDLLPDKIKINYINNIKMFFREDNNQYEKFLKEEKHSELWQLIGSLAWRDTIEGNEYWRQVHTMAISNEIDIVSNLINKKEIIRYNKIISLINNY